MFWTFVLLNLTCAMKGKEIFAPARIYERHPTEKMRKMLESVNHDARLCVLLTTGSMNPIHKAHVHGFDCAREHLKHEGYEVVGGFLSPSDKGWSSRKKFGAIKNEHKLKMAELAVEDSDWIACDGWEIGNGMIDFPEVYKDLKRQLRGDFPEKQIEIFYLCGEDHAMNTWCWEYLPTCVIKREYEGKSEDFLEESKTLHKVGVDKHNEKLDYSSTKIREALSKNHLDKVKDMMNPKAFEYLARNSEQINKELKK